MARALEATVAWSAAHARVVICAFALLVLAAGWAAARSLRIDVDTDAMISAELPHQQRWLAFAERYPLLAKPLLVLVEGPSGEAQRAAQALGERMRARPELFAAVRVPGEDPFLRRHGLLYRSPEELEDLSDHLVQAQPFLASLARDPSLRGLLGLLDRALAYPDQVAATDLPALLDDLTALLEGRRPERSLVERALRGVAVDPAREAVVLALPDEERARRDSGQAALAAVHAIAAELGLDAEAGYRVRVTGELALSADELALLRGNGAWVGVASFVLVTVILFMGLRSRRLVLALCLTLLAGLALTAGFAALAVGRLNMISVAFAVMSIGLGVDFGIHFAARAREAAAGGASPRVALRAAGRETGASLLLCALTTALGFAAFLPTEFIGIAEFGLISGTGILISVAVTLLLLPALVAALDPPLEAAPAPRFARGFAALVALPQRRPRAVLLGAGLTAALAAAVLPSLRFAGNPLELRVPDSESASAFRELLARDGDTTWNLHVIGLAPEAARTLAAELAQRAEVARATTLSDLVPERQAEKLELLADLDWVLGPLVPVGTAPSHAERLAALREFAEDVDCASPGGPVDASACRLREAALALAGEHAGPGRAADLAELEEAVVGPLAQRTLELAEALRVGPVTMAELPESLRELWQASDGSWRVEAVPAGPLAGDAEIAAFADGVREVAPEATGVSVNVVEAERAVVRALQQAFALATAGISLLLLARWRRVVDVGRVLLPLGLAALWILATATLLGMTLNFANVIVLPLILGIGIDSGVHLVDRYRGGEGERSLLQSSTSQAVVLSALTTLASFGSLAFSPHPGMASMGRLLTFGVAFTVLGNLWVLPALLALGGAPPRRPSTARAVQPPARPTEPARG